MQYIYNFLWFLAGVFTFGAGFVLLIPALLLVTITKIISVTVVTSVFIGLLILTKLLGGSAQQIRYVRDSGKSCIKKL